MSDVQTLATYDHKSSEPKESPEFIKEWEDKIKAKYADLRTSAFDLADLIFDASIALKAESFKQCLQAAGISSSKKNIKSIALVAITTDVMSTTQDNGQPIPLVGP